MLDLKVGFAVFATIFLVAWGIEMGYLSGSLDELPDLNDLSKLKFDDISLDLIFPPNRIPVAFHTDYFAPQNASLKLIGKNTLTIRKGNGTLDVNIKDIAFNNLTIVSATNLSGTLTLHGTNSGITLTGTAAEVTAGQTLLSGSAITIDISGNPDTFIFDTEKPMKFTLDNVTGSIQIAGRPEINFRNETLKAEGYVGNLSTQNDQKLLWLGEMARIQIGTVKLDLS